MKTTIKITYKLGSKFQERFANETLRGIMDIYKKELEKQHKDNKVKITIK